jgi:hypothetical protein
MLLQELFHLTLVEGNTMTENLRAAREKMSELARIGTKLVRDVKVAILIKWFAGEPQISGCCPGMKGDG